MVRLENIVFDYESSSFRFSFTLNKGDNLALVGASGAGKSTLLNLIAGFYTPKLGKIFIGNEDVTNIPPYLRSVTTMSQEHNLFPHLTVEQNIAIGLNPDLKLTENDIERLEKIVYKVSLNGLQSRYPGQISGGQRQRVALARCILRKKSVLLLDEPFTALDPSLRMEMLELLKNLRKEHNLAIIMATHYPEDSYSLCNKTAFLFGNTIYKLDYTEAIFNAEKDLVIQGFLGKNKFKASS